MKRLSKRERTKIRYYAYKVRKAVEKMARKEVGFCTETLECLCARASAMLSYKLNQVGIRNNIVYGNSHVYIKCKNYVVDITAKQFGNYAKVLIRSQADMEERECYWATSKKFRSINEAIKWQKRTHWSEEQIIKKSDLEYL